MTERRPRSQAAPRPSRPARPARFAFLRRLPSLPSGRGLWRLAARGSLAALSIAVIATFAQWSSSGFLDRGGLERLVRMKNTPERQAAPGQVRAGAMDRGRLNAVIAATGRSP